MCRVGTRHQIFERELARLAVVQVESLEESEEEQDLQAVSF